MEKSINLNPVLILLINSMFRREFPLTVLSI